MEVTVCTLVRNRTTQLVNQVRGLLASTTPPVAQVVAVMGGEDPRGAVPDTPWPTRFVDVAADGDLPLARARNVAVRTATTPGVVLLDVDCIPEPSLVAAYATALDALDGILMGGVRYLGPDWERGDPPSVDPPDLRAAGQPHPSRPDPPEAVGALQRTDAYHLFWSLSFAARRATLLEVAGGFDEGYGGYGAEDTDLAFRARDRGVPLAWVGGALAHHQHHETFDPPVQHVASIVGNARRFRELWGRWPMEGWLAAFDRMGLVAWEPDGAHLELLREATEQERASAHRRTALPGSGPEATSPA